jgi:hypothetical protein
VRFILLLNFFISFIKVLELQLKLVKLDFIFENYEDEFLVQKQVDVYFPRYQPKKLIVQY